MKLDVGDRLVLLSILPKEGDLTTIRIVHDLRQALSFSEEELKTLNIRSEGEGMVWDGADGVKEIPIGPQAQVRISEVLERLDKEEKITEDHLSLWEKFEPK